MGAFISALIAKWTRAQIRSLDIGMAPAFLEYATWLRSRAGRWSHKPSAANQNMLPLLFSRTTLRLPKRVDKCRDFRYLGHAETLFPGPHEDLRTYNGRIAANYDHTCPERPFRLSFLTCAKSTSALAEAGAVACLSGAKKITSTYVWP